MSIAAFYRTYIPFVETYSYYEEGEGREENTPPVWMKVNIQPYKQGLQFDLTQTGVIYNDWKTIYSRGVPEYDTSNIPADATLLGTHAYFGGQWYAVTATQDWTTPGRAPKHYKYLAIAQTGQAAIDWPEPVPLGTLVDSFEAAVRELQQAVIIYNNQL